MTDTRLYAISGQVFFASAEIFADRFDLRDTARRARIDLTHPHLWDITAVGPLDDVAATMRGQRMLVEVVGLNEASIVLVDRHAPLMRDLAT